MFETMSPGSLSETSEPSASSWARMHEMAGEDLDHWTSDSLSTRLIELLELRERLDAELTRVAATWHRKRTWEADGALSPVAWLTHRAPIATLDARHLINTARVIDEYPPLAAALADGHTTAAHVGVLARVMSPQRASLLGEDGEVLTEQAERLGIKDFTTLARRWAAIADDHLATDAHPDHRPRNELHATVTMDGWIDGTFRLNPASGSQLLAALDHLAPPDPADDPSGIRSLAERRGDAIVDLAGSYIRGDKPGGNPPNIHVVIDVASLNGDTSDLAQTRCDLDGVGPVTRATLEQIGCGATLTRVVMAGESVVLDMGRKTRFATPTQRRALRIRDGG